ncbi:MAG: SpoIIE family protein phosphatase [Bacteroidales bacterium]|jgi:serine phosphatase RsbU (regulator of sigma subunit)|nr:SpoIIE family protein phosphatase [Bacteroidales bacterium]
MKVPFTTILFCLLVSFLSPAQKPVYTITNYTTKEYGRDFHPTVTDVVQDERGIIYAANGFTILEYDGQTWNSYSMNRQAWIISLAAGPDGIIYSGSQAEFGYFQPDLTDGLRYVSLSDSLDIADMGFTNVWKVSVFDGTVAFQAEEKLFLYRDGKITVINPETSFHTSFVVNDRLFVRQREKGLMEWDGEKFDVIPEGSAFSDTGVFLMLPFGQDGNSILIGTREIGFWIYNNEEIEEPLRRLTLPGEEMSEDSRITCGALSAGGKIALGTMLSGILIIDGDGNIESVISRKEGLGDNEIRNIISDRNGNLWAALNNGLSRIDVSSPLSWFDDRSGLEGSALAVARYRGQLFTGTTAGLFISGMAQEGKPAFTRVREIGSTVRSLRVAGNMLVAGTDEGLFTIKEGATERIAIDKSYSLHYSPYLKLLFSGGEKGIVVLNTAGRFETVNLLEPVNDDIVQISEQKTPDPDSTIIWVGTRYNGAVRLSFRKGIHEGTVHFNSADGLPDGPIFPFAINDSVLFGTTGGLYTFTDEKRVMSSLPDSLKNLGMMAKGYFSPAGMVPREIGLQVSVMEQDNDRVWICADNMVFSSEKGNPTVFINTPFRGIDAGKVNTIYPEDNAICWIGTTEGLVRYDGSVEKDYDIPYHSLVRRVTTMQYGSVLFAGTETGTGQAAGIPGDTWRDNQIRTIRYSSNSLRFDFAAPYFEFGDKMLFSCFLEGYDPDWIEWEKRNFREYTNLHEGSYTFRVRALNVYGRESLEASWDFTIMPPWHRTTSAFIIYAILLLLLTWSIARLYSYRLRRENIRLEGIVTERTAEVVSQKNEIETKNRVLEEQKKEIEDSIKYARRIQTAVIPAEKDFSNVVPGSFVFFRPLHIVSGDFYWTGKIEEKIIVCAADCTGHGVPGAFMSMLGVAFLNEIVNKDRVTEPDRILNNLRDKVIEALQQHGRADEAKDGMDIALVCIDKEAGRISFAGAYNPMLMVRNGEISEYNADRMPIAIYDNMKPFTAREVAMEPGDSIYLFSDGFIDQFGGPEGKKFKMNKFKALLLEINKYPPDERGALLEKAFLTWMGDNPRIDDVLVIGIRLNEYYFNP